MSESTNDTSATVVNGKQLNIVKLTIPLFFEMLLAILVSNIDQLMLSTHSQEAVSAIGNSGQISWILMLFFQVLGTASLILITQYKGAGKDKQAEAIYPVTLIVNAFIGILISLVSIFAIGFIFKLMNVESGLSFEYAKLYMQIIGISFFFMAINNCFGSFLKANGFVKETMFISIFVNILNVIGNAFGLYVLDLGVAGVAYSTTLSRLIGMILTMVVFLHKVGVIHFSAMKNINPWKLLKQLLGIGVPSVGENMSYDMAQLVLMSCINTMGLAAVNAKVYVSLVVQFAYLFCMALSQSMQIIEGYQIGAGNKDAAAKVVYKSLWSATIVCFCVTFLLFLGSDYIIGIFPSADAEVLEIAKKLLFVELFLEIGRSVNITMVRALQTAGDVKYPVIMSIIFTWCLSVTLGIVLGMFWGLGIVGIWIATAADELCRGTVLILRFVRGKWREISLVTAE